MLLSSSVSPRSRIACSSGSSDRYSSSRLTARGVWLVDCSASMQPLADCSTFSGAADTLTVSTAANNPAANHLLHCFIRSLLSVESLCFLFSIITEKSNVVNYILQYFVKQKLPQPQRVGEFAEILFVIFQQRRRAFMSRIWVPRGRRSDFPPNRYMNRARAQPLLR